MERGSSTGRGDRKCFVRMYEHLLKTRQCRPQRKVGTLVQFIAVLATKISIGRWWSTTNSHRDQGTLIRVPWCSSLKLKSSIFRWIRLRAVTANLARTSVFQNWRLLRISHLCHRASACCCQEARLWRCMVKVYFILSESVGVNISSGWHVNQTARSP